MKKDILARHPHGLPTLVAAGPFLFTAGCDGHRGGRDGAILPALAGEAEQQSEIAYGAIQKLLRQADCELSSVVRLDHATSSQDWLPRRQSIRQRFFGRPAPLASTGVAARMSGINMLTASAIAVRDPAAKKVLVPGADYGMANLASVVRGGPFLFLSGVRGTTDPRNGKAMPEETPEAFTAQTRLCYELIGAMLESAGATPASVLRLDCYLRDLNRAPEEAAIRLPWLAGASCVSTVVGLPLGARGEVEITALALDPAYRGNAGFVFAQAREAQLDDALSVLEADLRAKSSDLSRVARLDLYLRDIYGSDAAHAGLLRRFGDSPPVVCTLGADLADGAGVQLSAIAVRG